jgi:hypothetical protein
MRHTPGVWLVIGIQAAGKSTVADLLSRRFERGVHVRGGQFYRWATTGWEQPSETAVSPRARELLDLRYRLAALCADEYVGAGFTCVVQDNLYGADVSRWLDRLRSRPRHLVVLRPNRETVAARDAARLRVTGKVAYRPGQFTIAGLDAALDATPRLGLWLDTSLQTPAETVAEILRRRDEAVVG